jgi:hypothetical protein
MRTRVSIPAVLLGAVLLAAGCSSSSKSDGSPRSPAGSSTGQSTTTTSTPGAAGDGSAKADFIAKADAICKQINDKLATLPDPTGPTDYAAILATGEESLADFPGFIAKIKAAVAQSPDKDELTAKWVSLDEADFAGQKPLLDKVLAAARAKDADQTGQYLNQLSNYKDHSAEAAAYLTSYGLADCATLEQA